jgi:hypothetical protein
VQVVVVVVVEVPVGHEHARRRDVSEESLEPHDSQQRLFLVVQLAIYES